MSAKTGAEVLIETRVAIDKIESFRNESFQPEEIQLIINKSQLRLMDDLINKNFQQGTLRFEWLRPFQSSGAGASPPDWPSPSVLSALATYPADMFYLISASGTSTISTTDIDAKYEDGCEQPIEDPTTIENPKSKTVQLDIIETGQAIDRTHNAFYGNNKRSPRAEAKTDGLLIFRDEYFIISAVSFDYCTEPPLIELEGLTSTDDLLWSTAAIQKIIDYTVEYLRLTIEDPGYQANVNDFNTRTQNA